MDAPGSTTLTKYAVLRGWHAMKRTTKLARAAITILLLTLWCPGLSSDEGLTADSIAVLTHPDLEISKLSRTELQAIFTLRKRSWDDKTPVRVFVLRDNHPIHRAFCKYKLGVYPYVLRDQWDRLTFSGTGHAPTVINDPAKLADIVRSTPGAIGYGLSKNDESIASQSLNAKRPSQDLRRPDLLRPGLPRQELPNPELISQYQTVDGEDRRD